jgi:hypothetical protein
MNTWLEAHKFLLNLEVGEGYGTDDNRITLTKKTKKTLYLSDKKIIHIKKMDNFFYLDAKGNSITQILRDIEGYLIYKIHDYNIWEK